jgi:type VI secretion system protein ImpK
MHSTNMRQRQDNMALIFQEVLTVAARLRAGRQPVTDAAVFRNQMGHALRAAEADGVRCGYQAEDMKMASFAVAAFLDESVLQARNEVSRDWRRYPLLEELFGVADGGERFFRNAERLLGRAETETLADLLEVHQMCLLLGFAGSGEASRDEMVTRIGEKIRQIRGEPRSLGWQPPAEMLRADGDKWIAPLCWTATVSAVIAVLLFLFFQVSLTSKTVQLRAVAGRVRGTS